MGSLRGPLIAERAGVRLLHVEHVDGLRSEGVDVGRTHRHVQVGERGADR